MKGLLGALIIIISYLIAGYFLGSWPLKYEYDYDSWEFLLISYSILSVFLYISARIVNRYKKVKGIIILVIWILISTSYGLFKMKQSHDLYYSDGWRSFFGWEFALWEFLVPLYIGIPQIIFIVGYFIASFEQNEGRNSKA